MAYIEDERPNKRQFKGEYNDRESTKYSSIMAPQTKGAAYIVDERPKKRRFKEENNNRERIEHLSFMAPQAEGAAPVDVPVAQESMESDGLNEENKILREGSQEDPRIGDISWRAAPRAEGEDLTQLHILANMASQCEYIIIPLSLEGPQMLAESNTSSKASSQPFLSPATSISESKSPERVDNPDNQSGEREIPTPPMSQRGKKISKSSEEDASKDAHEFALALAQATQQRNSLAYKQPLLAAPLIGLKHPQGNAISRVLDVPGFQGQHREAECNNLDVEEDVEKNAPWCLIRLSEKGHHDYQQQQKKETEEMEADQTQDVHSAPSVFRNLGPRLGKNTEYISHASRPANPFSNMSRDQFDTYLDNQPNPNDSDSDTLDDPQWVRTSEFPERSSQ